MVESFVGLDGTRRDSLVLPGTFAVGLDLYQK